ncbi:hypothetical protein HDV02_002687 [Globomyces sp. JEL0801]|nr:hypothetical protein HDV02_002687 [Globomyces sp. JEL0801]
MSNTDSYTNFQKLYQLAHKSISQGVDIEEANGDVQKAIKAYELGEKYIKQALSINFSNQLERNGIDSKAKNLSIHLQQIQERMQILKASLNSSTNNGSYTFWPYINSFLGSNSSANGTPKEANQVTSTVTKQVPNVNKKRPRDPSSVALAHQILDEILVDKPSVHWNDVIGLDGAKKSLYEIVVLPYLRPDLFTGLRAPGTGKTMLAKAVASESKARFFAVSASTLTSKNYGEGEKLVKALFEMARELQPSIIFIDEIDSILTERSDSEHEASRRLKTEFLLQFDGIGSNSEERILLLAATNRPQELDQAALRRLTKRIYIPLPEIPTRISLLKHLLKNSQHSLSAAEFQKLGTLLDGYSSSDITALAKEAAMGPIRSLGQRLMNTPSEKIRPIGFQDFKDSLKIIRPSVSPDYINQLLDWNEEKGSSSI